MQYTAQSSEGGGEVVLRTLHTLHQFLIPAANGDSGSSKCLESFASWGWVFGMLLVQEWVSLQNHRLT